MFPYLTVKDYYRLFEFLIDTWVYMQPEALNIGLKQVLKAASSKR